MVSKPDPASLEADDLHDPDSTLELPALDMEAYASDQPDADDPLSTGSQPVLSLAPDASGGDIADFEAEIIALGADVQRLRAELEQRDGELAERSSDIAALTVDLQQQNNRVEHLDEQLRNAASTVDSRVCELDSIVARLTAEREQFVVDSQALRGRAEGHVERLRDAEGRRGIFESLLIEREAALELASDERDAAGTQLRDARATIAALEERLAAQADRIAAADAARENQEGQLAGEARQVEDLRRALVQRDVDLRKLQGIEAELRTQLLSALEQSTALETEQQEAAKAHVHLQAEIARHAALHTNAAARSERLDKDLVDARQKAATFSAERDAARESLEESRMRVTALESRIDAIETAAAQRASGLETRLAAAEQRAHKLDLELSVKAARLSALDTMAGARRPQPSIVAPPEAAATGGDGVNEAPARDERPSSEALPARYLVLLDGAVESVFLLKPRTTIGRGEDNEIRLDRASVSRHHAVLLSHPNYSVIEDLGSTNGVVVNKRRTRRAMLRDGDIIYVGKCRLRYSEKPRQA